jgi:hypothetical protein
VQNYNHSYSLVRNLLLGKMGEVKKRQAIDKIAILSQVFCVVHHIRLDTKMVRMQKSNCPQLEKTGQLLFVTH